MVVALEFGMIHALLDLVWPPRCAACDVLTRGSSLCVPCESSVVSGVDHACPRCGGVYLTPVPGGGDHTCGACLQAPPPWVRATGALAYGGALRDAIVRWKNKPDHTLGPGLVAMMVAQASAAGWDRLPPHTVVVPIPSPLKQLRRRGFNPAGLLARGLAAHIGRPLVLGLRLTRSKGSSRGLSRTHRARRLSGLFRAHPHALRGSPVLLVDDVMTTGATARAAALACRRGGASPVEVAVLARAPMGVSGASRTPSRVARARATSLRASGGVGRNEPERAGDARNSGGCI